MKPPPGALSGHSCPGLVRMVVCVTCSEVLNIALPPALTLVLFDYAAGLLLFSAFPFGSPKAPMTRQLTPCDVQPHIQSFLFTALLLALLLFCASCAPKDISSGGADVDARYYGPPGPDTNAEMRYPTTGSLNYKREKQLYNMSNPSYFEAMQEWRMNEFKRRMDRRSGMSSTSPENPSYREKPKQKSPFRE